jgi:hypothetical protein
MKMLFWIMREQLDTFELTGEYASRGQLGIMNSRELKKSLREFKHSLPGDGPFCQQLPNDFLRAQLKMPQDPFAPDYWRNNNFHFVSAKFREVMGSIRDAVQFFPLHSIKGNADAIAQDYNLMHIRATQLAIDIEKSDLKTEEKISVKTQEPYLHLFDIEKLILRADILSKPELFIVKEIPSIIMVADTLAQRVLETECTGVTFYEPASAYNYFSGVRRYKTADGIESVEK